MKIKNDILNGRNEGGSFVSFGIVNGTQGGHYSPSVSDSGELTWTASDDRMPEIEGGNIVGPPATTDKTLSEAGKMADAHVVGEEFTSIDTLLKNTKKSDIEIERRLTNLEYALDDYLCRPFTDDTPAYIKAVPDGVLPKATLDSFGGKSKVIDGEIFSAMVSEIVSSSGTAITIPTSITSLPGYGWSAGSVCNEVDLENGQYIQRVGSVDLGSMTGVLLQSGDTSSTHWVGVIRNSYFDSIKAPDSKMLCDKFVNIRGGVKNDYAIWNDTNNVRFALPISVVSDLNIARIWLNSNNPKLYYELAEPIVTDISDLLPDNVLEVEAGGTITFENEHKLSVPNQITYLVKTEGG